MSISTSALEVRIKEIKLEISTLKSSKTGENTNEIEVQINVLEEELLLLLIDYLLRKLGRLHEKKIKELTLEELLVKYEQELSNKRTRGR